MQGLKITTAAGIVALAALAGCNKEAVEADAPAVQSAPGAVTLGAAALKEAAIQVVKAGPATLAPLLSFQGDLTLLPERRVKVPSVVQGVVRRVHVREGDRVTKGAPLLEVESRELGEAGLAMVEARHRLSVAREALQREQALHAKGISATERLVAAKHEAEHAGILVRMAAAKLRVLGISAGTARKVGASQAARLARHTLRAPLAGTVVSLSVVTGEAAASGAELMEVADLSQLQVTFRVPAAALSSVKHGAPVRVLLPDLKRTVDGKISGVAALVDPASRTAHGRATVANLDGSLRPGISAVVRLESAHWEAPVAVPALALHEVDGKQLVFVQQAPGQFRAAEVTLGRSDAARVEIKAGLKAGEAVATTNSLVLKSAYMKEGE